MYDYQTSMPAFQQAQKTSNHKQQDVLNAIKRLGICSDHQIAEFLGWPINRVTPRRGELVISNKVNFAFRSKDFDTGRSVNFWQFNNQI
jgi:hypothetical protein